MDNLIEFPPEEQRVKLKIKDDLEKKITRGELVLLRTRRAKDPILAIVNDIETDWAHRESLSFYSSQLALRQPINIKGKTYPIVAFRLQNSLLTSHINEIYTGKEEIIRYCRERGWQEHIDWIEQLEKPYNLPGVKTITFIDPLFIY